MEKRALSPKVNGHADNSGSSHSHVEFFPGTQELKEKIKLLELQLRIILHDTLNFLTPCLGYLDLMNTSKNTSTSIKENITEPRKIFASVLALVQKSFGIIRTEVQPNVSVKKLETRYESLQNIARDEFPLIEEGLSTASNLIKSIDCENNDECLAKFKIVYEAADTACLLVQSEGRVLRGESAEIEPCLVNVVDTLSKLMPALNIVRKDLRVRVEISFSDKNIEILTSPVALEDAILNLVINAKDASAMNNSNPEDRLVEISVTIRFVPSLNRECVSLEIKDNGFGMSDEIKAKIFEPGFTTKGENGSGIGLPSVKRFVEKSNGFIEVKSVEGQGSTFTIFLPLAEKAKSAVA